jgi:hypothetical protein
VALLGLSAPREERRGQEGSQEPFHTPRTRWPSGPAH